jgi:hypothetical protein
VRIMAILAGRGVVVAGFKGQAVDAGVVAFGMARVADGAIDGLERNVVVGMTGGGVCMATDARIGAVNGGGEPGLVNEQRDDPAVGIGLGERIVAVAIETIAVPERGGGQSKGRPNQRAENENEPGAAHHLIVTAAARKSFAYVAVKSTVFVGFFMKPIRRPPFQRVGISVPAG